MQRAMPIGIPVCYWCTVVYLSGTFVMCKIPYHPQSQTQKWARKALDTAP